MLEEKKPPSMDRDYRTATNNQQAFTYKSTTHVSEM